MDFSHCNQLLINGVITRYILAYGTESGELSSENIVASVTSYTVAGLEENTVYTFRNCVWRDQCWKGRGSSAFVTTLPDGG